MEFSGIRKFPDLVRNNDKSVRGYGINRQRNQQAFRPTPSSSRVLKKKEKLLTSKVELNYKYLLMDGNILKSTGKKNGMFPLHRSLDVQYRTIKKQHSLFGNVKHNHTEYKAVKSGVKREQSDKVAHHRSAPRHRSNHYNDEEERISPITRENTAHLHKPVKLKNLADKDIVLTDTLHNKTSEVRINK
ncbi:unnamed protein product [Mytilus edulis]|uniref:Uncharacterized protein n=1 Tax=Mytilus edulis TaxID=6550 RepID=A0A8S3V6L3_MYTED|nr:unnamed protein product [Mytilus edulis]